MHNVPRKLILSLLLVAACCTSRWLPAQALAPLDAQKRFKVADGFEVQLFASEPDVRQPVTMTFDSRGRMWVIQYLQYPAPKDLKAVEVDRYLRTRYDRVPEPPPQGPRGADKITILEDTDGDGRADRAKDFVSGLNLASALALGNGGVYVGQAPYLLFYPDRDGDDVPDGDPEVLLRGFGMEDAHAVVNSLQWGPDGWLYGTQGSTVTADIHGIGFQQGIWRYHPATKRFELFSEGGGNTWGLDFDRHGNAIAGTNWGDALGLHQVQGGYYVKGFSKHGPLHNPHTYGYFEHMKHRGHAGGHVTCGGIVYQGGAFPQSFNNTYVAANLLSNSVYWSAIEPAGSTFDTRYLGTLLETDDIWFRPIDCLGGPDGSVFVADWYDQRANHVIPEDTWDKTNGRIWKIVARGTSPVARFDLSKLSSDALVDLLSHANVWYRREARRILAERRDPAVSPRLQKLVDESQNQQLALEALWAVHGSGGWNDSLATRWLTHSNPDVRAWSIRLVGDDAHGMGSLLNSTLSKGLEKLAASEPSAVVRSQLACTCKRLNAKDGLPLVARLLQRSEDAADSHIPLLLWWAIEAKATSDREQVLKMFVQQEFWHLPLVEGTIVERLARRWMADADYESCAQLLAKAPGSEDVRRVVMGMDQGFSGRRLEQIPAPLAHGLSELWSQGGADPLVTRFALRLGSQAAYESALARMADRTQPQPARLGYIAAMGQAGSHDAVRPLVGLLADSPDNPEPIRLAALAALEHYADDSIASAILTQYPRFNKTLRARAASLLCSRKVWSAALIGAVTAGIVDAADVSVDQLRQMLVHADAELAKAIEARWGRVRSATPGEKQAYVPVLGRLLNEGKGDFDSGHKLFVKHCGTCHVMYGEGTKVGPDLTSADRKNRDALLLNILDPSGTIRPEFVSQVAVLTDGRVLTGLVVESSPQSITLVDAKNQRTTVPRGEVEEITPSPLSLMPEKLLETLAPQELRDLFRYLQSESSTASAAR